jgi:hypothetical protein
MPLGGLAKSMPKNPSPLNGECRWRLPQTYRPSTRSRPASVRQTLSPRSRIHPRATATAMASFVRSFSFAGTPHQRHSPSVARYIAHTRKRAALSFWSAISKLRFPVSSRCWGQVVSWDARLTPGRLVDSYSGFGLWLDSPGSPARQNVSVTQILTLAGIGCGECHIDHPPTGLHPSCRQRSARREGRHECIFSIDQSAALHEWGNRRSSGSAASVTA